MIGNKGVLLIRLEGTWQSWADSPRHQRVPTRREPTKSGVAGLLAWASGRDFGDDAFVARLAAMEQVVRCDKEGSVATDFHVVRDVPRAHGGKIDKNPMVTYREYLEGSSFLVALGGEAELLRELEQAVLLPSRPIWLGKKSCVPSRRLWVPGGLVETGETPRQVLERWSWSRPSWNAPGRLRLVLDLGIASTEGEIRHDFPISLHPEHRKFATRRIGLVWIATDELPVEDETGDMAASGLAMKPAGRSLARDDV